MHEFSTAKGIVETILTVAKENGAKRITEVNLQIGILTMLNPEQLEFAFQVLTEDTIAKDARLNISYSPMKLICKSCRAQRRHICESNQRFLGSGHTFKVPQMWKQRHRG